MSEELEFLGVFGALLYLVYAALPFFLALWILKPLDDAARWGQHKTQFAMVDFLGLVFVLALPMAMVRLVGSEKPDLHVVLIFCCWSVSGTIWAVGVSTLSKSGVTSAKDRAIVVCFVLPCAYFAAFAIFILPPLIVSAFSIWLVVAEMLLIPCVIAAGLYSRRIANQSMNRSGPSLRTSTIR